MRFRFLESIVDEIGTQLYSQSTSECVLPQLMHSPDGLTIFEARNCVLLDDRADAHKIMKSKIIQKTDGKVCAQSEICQKVRMIVY